MPPTTHETPLLRELARPWNLMSLVRIPLAVAAFAARGDAWQVVALMVLAGISDGLDGAMARRAHADPRLGAWLDPVCDKVFVLSVLVGAWIEHQPSWWLLALTATRELLVVPASTLLMLASGGVRSNIEYRARPSGKATTVAQFVVLGGMLFDLPYLVLPAAVAASILGLAAGVEYGIRARGSLEDATALRAPNRVQSS